jgi:hypothetical protein
MLQSINKMNAVKMVKQVCLSLIAENIPSAKIQKALLEMQKPGTRSGLSPKGLLH